MEETVVLIKPDAIVRGLVGEVLTRLERKGLQIVGVRMVQLSDDVLRDHYRHLEGREFFGELVRFMRSVPTIAVCLKGIDAVRVVRELTGETNSRDAPAGTIRGDLGMSVQRNLVHASDSRAAAKVEIVRFFPEGTKFSWEHDLRAWLYSPDEA